MHPILDTFRKLHPILGLTLSFHNCRYHSEAPVGGGILPPCGYALSGYAIVFLSSIYYPLGLLQDPSCLH